MPLLQMVSRWKANIHSGFGDAIKSHQMRFDRLEWEKGTIWTQWIAKNLTHTGNSRGIWPFIMFPFERSNNENFFFIENPSFFKTFFVHQWKRYDFCIKNPLPKGGLSLFSSIGWSFFFFWSIFFHLAEIFTIFGLESFFTWSKFVFFLAGVFFINRSFFYQILYFGVFYRSLYSL